MTNRTGEGGGIQTKILGISKNEKIKDIQVLISEWSNPLLQVSMILSLLIDSPINPISWLWSLLFVVLVTMIKQGYEDYLRCVSTYRIQDTNSQSIMYFWLQPSSKAMRTTFLRSIYTYRIQDTVSQYHYPLVTLLKLGYEDYLRCLCRHRIQDPICQIIMNHWALQ